MAEWPLKAASFFTRRRDDGSTVAFLLRAPRGAGRDGDHETRTSRVTSLDVAIPAVSRGGWWRDPAHSLQMLNGVEPAPPFSLRALFPQNSEIGYPDVPKIASVITVISVSCAGHRPPRRESRRHPRGEGVHHFAVPSFAPAARRR
jgi:hypothetical protein